MTLRRSTPALCLVLCLAAAALINAQNSNDTVTCASGLASRGKLSVVGQGSVTSTPDTGKVRAGRQRGLLVCLGGGGPAHRLGAF